MNKLFKVLLILILMVPILPTLNSNASGCFSINRPSSVSDYRLGEWAFKDIGIANDYMYSITMDLSNEIGSYPSNYIFENAEIAIFNEGKIVSTVSFDNSSNTCVNLDLGSPDKYAIGKTYEIKFRLSFSVLTTEVEKKTTDWKAYDPTPGSTSDINSLFFQVEVPKPMRPDAFPLDNTYSVGAIDAPYVIKRTNNGSSTSIPRTNATSNSIILTDKNEITLNHMTNAMYTSRVDRLVNVKNGSSYDNLFNEKLSSNPDNDQVVNRTQLLPLNTNVVSYTFQSNNKLYRSDVLDLNTPIYEFTDLANVYVIRDIFNKLYDINVTTSGNNYTLKLTQKTGLTADEKTLLNNSATLFGINLNQPSFVITENPLPNIKDYTTVKKVSSLNTNYTVACTGCSNPILRIGYPDMTDKSYTFSMPLKEIVSVNFSNIADSGIVNIGTGIFRPEVSLKQNKNIFKFPSGSDFDWNTWEDLKGKLEVFVYEVTNPSLVPANLNKFIDSKSSYTYKYYGTITNQATDTLTGLTISDAGTYIIGAKLTNRLGEVTYSFKEFKLIFGETFGNLPIENNLSYQLNDKHLINNNNIAVHELNLVQNNALVAPSAYNYKHNGILIGSVNGGTKYLKAFKYDLTEIPLTVDLPTNTKVYSIVEYADGFLVGTSSGLAYADLTTNTVKKITTSGTAIYDIEVEGINIYLADKQKLIIGRLSGNTFTEIDSLTKSEIFKSASYDIKNIEIVNNKIIVTPLNNTGSNSAPVAIIDKI